MPPARAGIIRALGIRDRGVSRETKVGTAARAAPGAVFVRVARVHSRPADHLRTLEGVHRTCRAAARAAFRQVAEAGRLPALDGVGLEGVRRAGVGRSVAAFRQIADTGGCTAFRRTLGIGGTRRGRAAAAFGDVADSGGRAALDGVCLESIRRTVVAGAVAAFRQVAIPGGPPALRGELDIRRARGARAGAGLGRVANDPRLHDRRSRPLRNSRRKHRPRTCPERRRDRRSPRFRSWCRPPWDFPADSSRSRRARRCCTDRRRRRSPFSDRPQPRSVCRSCSCRCRCRSCRRYRRYCTSLRLP